MADAFSRISGGRETTTVSPGLAPTGLPTSICMVSPEEGWHMLLALHDPQASDLTRETVARPSVTFTTFAVSSNNILYLQP